MDGNQLVGKGINSPKRDLLIRETWSGDLDTMPGSRFCPEAVEAEPSVTPKHSGTAVHNRGFGTKPAGVTVTLKISPLGSQEQCTRHQVSAAI